jgi:putative transposase
MGLEALYRKPNTSRRHPHHCIYPYLLKDLAITRPNQVWTADITYIPMAHGFMVLVAVMDWHSRKMLSWRLSNSLDGGFCREALEEALERYNPPEIMNTDQGTQFTAHNWIECLQAHNVQISMDGKGRFLDNIFIERLWRSVKYEDVYLKRYETVAELKAGLAAYFEHYNSARFHQALEYLTPEAVYQGVAARGSGFQGSGCSLRLSSPNHDAHPLTHPTQTVA